MEKSALDQIHLLWGAKEIAATLGVSKARAFHLLERGEIPAKKVGGRWVVDETLLRDFFRDNRALKTTKY